MNHTLILVSIVLIAFTPTEPAAADMCTLDVVPSATLLLPYFEVDLDSSSGVTTLISINNALPKPALVHLIFWTDWSYPTIGFDVYLTGYDVVMFNLRDVFDGNIPITADAPNDPDQSSATCGTKSPCGGFFSQNRDWDDTDPDVAGEQGFPFCEFIFPGFNNPVIVGTAFSRLVDGHTGQLVPSLGACVGSDQGDNVARGYLTIDNVSECSLVLDPADDGLAGTPYFVDGGTGTPTTRTSCGVSGSTSIRPTTSRPSNHWCTSKRIRVSMPTRHRPVTRSMAAILSEAAGTTASLWARPGEAVITWAGPSTPPSSSYGAIRPPTTSSRSLTATRETGVLPGRPGTRSRRPGLPVTMIRKIPWSFVPTRTSPPASPWRPRRSMRLLWGYPSTSAGVLWT